MCFNRMLDVLASLALERLVLLAQCVLVKHEQFPECVDREVALGVLLFVHDGGGEGLLVCLSLEDLLLDRARGDEPVDEA